MAWNYKYILCSIYITTINYIFVIYFGFFFQLDVVTNVLGNILQNQLGVLPHFWQQNVKAQEKTVVILQ